MIQNLHKGAASISFNSPIYFESCASIVSQKEGEGPFGNLFDNIDAIVCEPKEIGNHLLPIIKRFTQQR